MPAALLRPFGARRKMTDPFHGFRAGRLRRAVSTPVAKLRRPVGALKAEPAVVLSICGQGRGTSEAPRESASGHLLPHPTESGLVGSPQLRTLSRGVIRWSSRETLYRIWNGQRRSSGNRGRKTRGCRAITTGARGPTRTHPSFCFSRSICRRRREVCVGSACKVYVDAAATQPTPQPNPKPSPRPWP